MKLCYNGKAQRKYSILLSIKISFGADLQSSLTGDDIAKNKSDRSDRILQQIEMILPITWLNPDLYAAQDFSYKIIMCPDFCYNIRYRG